MYEIVTPDGAIVEVSWWIWRSYSGERLFCGMPYSGPVCANDEEREAA